ncbi:hypothetical protein AeMF1_009888 [Aphanomyces euteiches]|nr:hypothetical protein AeMF1_009888 [Aphanomyces euteiches]KAH9194733.1 hypothetical protein AeNC1_003283 [Aphanomyces euteiches]
MWSSTRKRQLTKGELETFKRIQEETDSRNAQAKQTRAQLRTIVRDTQPNDATLYTGMYRDSTQWTTEETLALAENPLIPLGPADISGKYHLRSIKHSYPIPGSQLLKEKQRMDTALAKKLSISIKLASSSSEPKLPIHASKSAHADCLRTLETGKLHFMATSLLDVISQQEQLLAKEKIARSHRLATPKGSIDGIKLFWSHLIAGRTREAVLLITQKEFVDLDVAVVLNGSNITIDATKSHSLTPLMAAARFLNVDVVMELLFHGADPNVANVTGDTPLHYVWHNIKPLKTYLISLKWTNQAQKACSIVDALLEHGALANSVNAFNETPLHLAAKRGVLDAVEKLLHKGADPSIQDRHGKSALDYAHNYRDAASLMTNFERIDKVRRQCDEYRQARIMARNPGTTSLAWSPPPDQLLQELKLASHRATYLKGHCVTRDGEVILAPDD